MVADDRVDDLSKASAIGMISANVAPCFFLTSTLGSTDFHAEMRDIRNGSMVMEKAICRSLKEGG